MNTGYQDLFIFALFCCLFCLLLFCGLCVSHACSEVSPPEFCRMKGMLKRVSPSTYQSRNDGDFGEGPTPMLTRALRRKFQVIIIYKYGVA